jgi:peptidoglycan hydrolase-like protein with peptidoglycan-binding domain
MQYIHNIADMPLDEWNGEDGDNSVLQFNVGKFDPDAPLVMSKSPMTATLLTAYVPFKRPLKLGSAGPDVRAVHRALRVATGDTPGTPTRLFGIYMKKRLIAFQKKMGLAADGVYGLQTHRALSKYFDEYGRWLLGQTRVLTTVELRRQIIVSTAMHGYANRYNIHYTQSSLRMQGVKQRIKPPGYPSYEDCSSFSTWLYWVAGCPDPNGLGYNGYGYTGTFAANGRRISTAEMKPGDAIFYGAYPHGHMTIYVGAGRCVSHGNEMGPSLLMYNYRAPNQIRSYF